MLGTGIGRRFAVWAVAAAIALLLSHLGCERLTAQGPRDRDDRRTPRELRNGGMREGGPAGFRDGGPRDAGPREGGPGGPSAFGRGFDSPTEITVKRGFVFIDGEYVAPPYEIRYADGKVSINGRELTCQPPARMFGGRGFGPRGGDQPWRFEINNLQSQLGNDCVLLSFKDQPYLVLDSSTAYELLLSLVSHEKRSMRQVEVMSRLPEDFSKQVWDDWIRDFTPPDELRQRAAVLVARYDTTQREAQAEIRATQWMNRLAYPLTLSSMVLTVLSIGHLLGGRPHANKPTFGLDISREMIHALNWSLFFAAAFSSIDLIWTILAANTNQMRELNPIGSHLIRDPRHLAGFKVGITFSCLAVLWLLRKHKRAQVAAWWICLILTLVTIRWLTFNSLFVSE